MSYLLISSYLPVTTFLNPKASINDKSISFLADIVILFVKEDSNLDINLPILPKPMIKHSEFFNEIGILDIANEMAASAVKNAFLYFTSSILKKLYYLNCLVYQ